jgi:hypothetical protein
MKTSETIKKEIMRIALLSKALEFTLKSLGVKVNFIEATIEQQGDTNDEVLRDLSQEEMTLLEDRVLSFISDQSLQVEVNLEQPQIYCLEKL